MTGRQLVNQNSYILAAGLVLLIAAYFVARFESLVAWLVWIGAVALLCVLYVVLRPGAGNRMTTDQLERLIGSGVPVVIELYSNY